ncbi:hypothetical protein OG883_39745 [Streptomyces sp. NBC_01142]|uniref:hypothetical protein n=1 Tax=Streptomyces sp. NBC_01142 TaxID=2975865 RepID=UPI002259EC52|nr:hypothetical protein [Streptomyces sp. NBC_01142]MCX4825847.1 hypothetical protein [Streptomyces sp. NBC_01142]
MKDVPLSLTGPGWKYQYCSFSDPLQRSARGAAAVPSSQQRPPSYSPEAASRTP